MESEENTTNYDSADVVAKSVDSTEEDLRETNKPLPEFPSMHYGKAPATEDFASNSHQLHATTESSQPSGAQPQEADHDTISLVGRQSRASSIFSTRTKFSTLTLDDARSIEISAGGQSFRISRDGSRITDITAPPPYPGPPDEDIDEEFQEQGANLESQDATVPATESTPSTPRISVSRQSMEHPIVDQDLTSSTATNILKRAFGMSGTSTTSASASASPDLAAVPNFLRRTQSDTSSYGWLRPWSRGSTANNRLARTSLEYIGVHENGSSSADKEILAEDADEDDDQNMGMQTELSYSVGETDLESSTNTVQRAQVIDKADGSQVIDREDRRAAEISSHYSGLMRDLDRENRRRLHEKDKELSHFRQLLHEKDVVLRQALRDKDFAIEVLRNQLDGKDAIIEDLKKRLTSLEDDVELQLERARNAVEDMWEERWKRERLLLGKMLSKRFEDAQDEFNNVVEDEAKEGKDS